MYRVWDFVTTYALLMMGGALLALIWANAAPESHHHVVDFALIEGAWIGTPTFGQNGSAP